jgi:hypothetical protein
MLANHKKKPVSTHFGNSKENILQDNWLLYTGQLQKKLNGYNEATSEPTRCIHVYVSKVS